MIIDYISIGISVGIVICFVIMPKDPAYLLLFFIIIYNIISFWHIYEMPLKNTYLTSIPLYMANKNNLNNKYITDFDLFFTVGMFSIVILLNGFIKTP